MESLIAKVDSLSIFGKAALAITLQLPADPSEDRADYVPAAPTPDVSAILRYMLSALRVTGRTAYVATSVAAAASAGQRANAAALSALSLARRAGAPAELLANIDKLANYVAKLGGSTGRGAACAVSLASSFDGFALRDYDVASGAVRADAALNLLAGANRLFSTRLRVDSPPPPPFVLPWSRLPSPPPPLLFALGGVGEIYVALA